MTGRPKGATTDPEQLLADVERRAAAAAVRWRPQARLSRVRPLTGGASSLTYLADVAGVAGLERGVVLKVSPPGLPPVRNRDVLRQGRLMRALHGRPGVLVPGVLFEDRGDPPLIAMEFVPGECVEPGLVPERDPVRSAHARARGLHAAQVLAALHAVEPAQVGLADEPVVPLSAEIDRWTTAFTTVAPDLQGDYLRCAEALHATTPPPMPPAVNHGDYRLGNTLCEGDRVTAVIDWEIWSVGDPRVDLSWLTFFTDEAFHPAAPSPEPTGLPTAQELLDTYLAARGGEIRDLAWFAGLTRYKEAAATALLIKRGRRAGSLHESLQRMEPALPQLLEQAHEFVGR